MLSLYTHPKPGAALDCNLGSLRDWPWQGFAAGTAHSSGAQSSWATNAAIVSWSCSRASAGGRPSPPTLFLLRNLRYRTTDPLSEWSSGSAGALTETARGKQKNENIQMGLPMPTHGSRGPVGARIVTTCFWSGGSALVRAWRLEATELRPSTAFASSSSVATGILLGDMQMLVLQKISSSSIGGYLEN